MGTASEADAPMLHGVQGYLRAGNPVVPFATRLPAAQHPAEFLRALLDAAPFVSNSIRVARTSA